MQSNTLGPKGGMAMHYLRLKPTTQISGEGESAEQFYLTNAFGIKFKKKRKIPFKHPQLALIAT